MPVELLSGFLRYRRAIVSGALAAVIAASRAYLVRGAGINMEMTDMGGGQIMTMPSEWSEPYAALIFVMWVVMMVAMMLQGAAPTVLLVTTLASDRPPIPSSFPPLRCSLHRDIFSSGAGSASPLPCCNGASTKPGCYPKQWRSATDPRLALYSSPQVFMNGRR